MKRLPERAVKPPAIVHKRARPIEAQELLGRFMAPRRIDFIRRGPRADESMQPSRATPHAPTRFVGCHLRRVPNVLPDLLACRPTALGRALDRADAGGPDNVQFLEHRS